LDDAISLNEVRMSADPREDLALLRFRIIGEAINPRLTPAERGHLVRELAKQAYEHPDGSSWTYSRVTLDRWIRAYREHGLDGLRPPPREFERPGRGTGRSLHSQAKWDDGEEDQQVVGGGQPGIRPATAYDLEVVVHGWQPQREGLQLRSIQRPRQPWRPGHAASFDRSAALAVARAREREPRTTVPGPHHPHIIGGPRRLVPDDLGSAILKGDRCDPPVGRVALLEWT